MINNDYDSVFSDYTEKVAQEAQAKAEAKAGAKEGKSRIEYDEIQYCSLDGGKIIRVVGGPIDSRCDVISPIRVTCIETKDDHGKKCYLYRPSFVQDRNYILNKILNAVTKKVFVENPDGTKTGICPCERDYPDLYNKIMKNGLAPSDPQYRYAHGLMGSEVVIANVIDRGDYGMHQEKKHTSILCKSINEYQDKKYPQVGVSAFATTSIFDMLTSAYGNLQNYDIYMKKTGEKNMPFIIKHAVSGIAEIPAELRGLVSSQKGLTEEEATWEAYDLQKYYHPSTAVKILNKLRETITEVDRCLGTSFIAELEELAAKETEEQAKLNAENGVAADETAAPMVEAAAPVARVARPAAPSEPAYKKLPNWQNCSQAEKDAIVDAVPNDKGGFTVTYAAGVNPDTLPVCPVCGTLSFPEDTACPGCGASFV